MGVKVKMPSFLGLDDMLRSRLTALDKAVIYRLEVLGEKCVNEAREHHGYTDRTGNLTSSIGYVIAKDGKIVRQSSFGQVLDGRDGTLEGAVFAREQASKYPKGYVLIVATGMNYAVYVSDKGYNVLDSAEILAGKETQRMMQELGLK